MIFKYYIEIKNRIFLLLFSWFLLIIICYLYKEILLFLCIKPVIYLKKNASLYFIFTNLTDIFSVYLQLTYFVGNQITFFFIFYHILGFLTPGIFIYEYKIFKFILLNGFLFWIFSILILNNILMPISWQFFLSFQQTIITQPYNFYFEAQITDYLNLYILLYNICNFNFQIFIFLNLYFYYNKKNIQYITQFRKLFYFFFLLISTCLTPPDIFSQILLSMFIIIFYEFIILINIFKTILISNADP